MGIKKAPICESITNWSQWINKTSHCCRLYAL